MNRYDYVARNALVVALEQVQEGCLCSVNQDQGSQTDQFQAGLRHLEVPVPSS